MVLTLQPPKRFIKSILGSSISTHLLPGPSMGKYPALLYLSIFLSAVGGFLFGYDTGVIAGAMPLIERDVPFWGEKSSGER